MNWLRRLALNIGRSTCRLAQVARSWQRRSVPDRRRGEDTSRQGRRKHFRRGGTHPASTLRGILHGGAYMAFADTLGAAATVLNLPEGKGTTTIESKTNFL